METCSFSEPRRKVDLLKNAKMLKNNQIDVVGPGWQLRAQYKKPWIEFSNPYTESERFRIVSIEPKKI